MKPTTSRNILISITSLLLAVALCTNATAQTTTTSGKSTASKEVIVITPQNNRYAYLLRAKLCTRNPQYDCQYAEQTFDQYETCENERVQYRDKGYTITEACTQQDNKKFYVER